MLDRRMFLALAPSVALVPALTTSSSPDPSANTAAALAYIRDLYNGEDYAAADRLLGPDFTPDFAGVSPGTDAFVEQRRRERSRLLETFADYRYTPGATLEQDRNVVVYSTFTGTLADARTGATAEVDALAFWWFAVYEGRITGAAVVRDSEAIDAQVAAFRAAHGPA